MSDQPYEEEIPRYCAQPGQTVPVLRPDLSPERASAIVVGRSKWVNGTVLRYCFLESGNGVSKTWLDEVHRGFQQWKDLGIGLEFQEVSRPADAEIRITFRQGDGSWSYIGRDCLLIGIAQPTMNFGWDPTSPHGRATVLHELAHALGAGHEHQNPFSGIEWDEEKVYAELGGPPNFWPRETVFHNVLRKLATTEVRGSRWDPESIMEYGFPPGLILRPEKYGLNGIPSPLKLSALDKEFVRQWYPPLAPGMAKIDPFQSAVLDLSSGEQSDFEINPPQTRKYQMGTFGDADVVMVLFEEVDGQLRYLTGEDDSGEDRNGRLEVKLFAGRRYVLRLRMYSAWGAGTASIMYW